VSTRSQSLAVPSRAGLAISALVALGGCSLIAETRQPHRTARGELTCHSYALPVFDALIGAGALPVGGLATYLGFSDRELSELRLPGVLILSVGVVSAIGAVVGFRDLPRCNRDLRATAPSQ
jgi:hypothetical protein